MTTSTQVKHPWRATVRTAAQAVVSLAAGAPLIYQAASNHSPEQATGAAALALAVAGGLSRVMATPVVEKFIGRFAPFLAAQPPAKAVAPQPNGDG